MQYNLGFNDIIIRWTIMLIIGIVGALLGGYIASMLGMGSVTGFNVMSLLIAVGGSLILLILYRVIKK